MENLSQVIFIIAAIPVVVLVVVLFCLRKAMGDIPPVQALNEFNTMKPGDRMYGRIWLMILWMFAFTVVFAVLGWG